MRHPHIAFLVSLVVIGPVLAIGGLSRGGAWGPIGVGLAGLVVGWAALRSLTHLRRQSDAFPPTRLRMMGLTASVLTVAAAVAIAAVIWLVAGLVR